MSHGRTKLESCMQQWQGYDEVYDSMAQWVKDTEVKVRNESGLKPDLPSKVDQLKNFKVCHIALMLLYRSVIDVCFLNVCKIIYSIVYFAYYTI